MKIFKEILSNITEKYHDLITWMLVFIFFFFSMLRVGFLFSFIHALIITLSMTLVSFIETKIFVRLLLQKRKRFLFYLSNVIMISLISALFMFFQFRVVDVMRDLLPMVHSLENNDIMYQFLHRVLIYTIVASFSAITYLQKCEQDTKRLTNDLKIENMNMELRYLKSQINPHFLFNALNNIYSLVYTHDEKAPDSVLKLSEMLRYVMVDCQADKISLDKEMRFIDNYIDFQLMKHESRRNISFEKNITNMGLLIPPMIFQPLVENSFKYSRIENDPDGFVRFSIFQDENTIEFVAENTVRTISNSLVSSNKKPGSGIGQENVKKRLKLYYKDDFSFSVKNENNIYTAKVKIKL
ncbi:MAG: sensor histidine kinase [Candidatus Limimorpha sp.]